MADDPKTPKVENESPAPPADGGDARQQADEGMPMLGKVGWQGTMVFLLLLALLAWGTRSSKTYEADPINPKKTYVAQETRSFVEQMAEPATARGVITLLFSMGTIWIAIQLMSNNSRMEKEHFDRGKDVLTILVGLLGTVFGFYFGSLSEQHSQMQAALEQRLDVPGAVGQNGEGGESGKNGNQNENASGNAGNGDGGQAGAAAGAEHGAQPPTPAESGVEADKPKPADNPV